MDNMMILMTLSLSFKFSHTVKMLQNVWYNMHSSTVVCHALQSSLENVYGKVTTIGVAEVE